MTQTNTDYLLQITPTVDRTYSAMGANADTGGFDDHLSQAASMSGDDSRNLSSCYQRADTDCNDRDDRSWNTNDSKPSGHDSGNVTSSQSSPSDQEESTGDVSGTKPPIENADSDDRDAEKAGDTTAAAAAGASQGSKGNAPKSNSKPESQGSANRPIAAKAAVLGKKAATNAGDQKATGTSDGQVPSNASSTETVEKAIIVANAATDAADANEESEESQDAGSEGKQSKATKSGAATKKLEKGESESNGVACNDSSAKGAGPGEVSPDVAQKTIDNEAASATQAEALATKSKSETDESSDDDSGTSSQNDLRPGTRNDTSVQTNKVDTAQLAVSTASLTDAGANATSKSKDGEETTKPIAAKSEPPSAAFARMTRNNITGPKDSTSGANDLPPIDPARFIGRVAKAFQTAQDRGGTLQLRLSPPELGVLRIELNVKDGVMSAALQTENANARRLLLDHLPALRDRLAEQNIRIDRFDVDVRREDTGSQTDARGSQQQQFQHQPDEPVPRRQSQPQPRAREVAAPERIARAPKGSNTGLNLIV